MTVEDAGTPQAENGDFWLFGYGQDHRGTPDAPGRVVTLIEQSFWATLTDPHPAPKDGKVWGIAYRIEPSHVAEVKEYLDIREINGYSIHHTPFHPAPTASQPAPAPIHTLVYIGTPTNAQFTGPQPVAALAAHIHRAAGPSGPNAEYLLSLDAALRALRATTTTTTSSGEDAEVDDEHVADLSRRVRALVAGGAPEDGRGDAAEPAGNAGRVVVLVGGSVEEQEETEKVL